MLIFVQLRHMNTCSPVQARCKTGDNALRGTSTAGAKQEMTWASKERHSLPLHGALGLELKPVRFGERRAAMLLWFRVQDVLVSGRMLTPDSTNL